MILSVACFTHHSLQLGSGLDGPSYEEQWKEILAKFDMNSICSIVDAIDEDILRGERDKEVADHEAKKEDEELINAPTVEENAPFENQDRDTVSQHCVYEFMTSVESFYNLLIPSSICYFSGSNRRSRANQP